MQGLNCANCANKIETDAGKLDNVSSASVNLITSSLTLTLRNSHDLDITEIIERIVHKYEPDVVVINKAALASERGDYFQTDRSAHNHGHGHVHDHGEDQVHSHEHGHTHEQGHGGTKGKITQLIAGAAIFAVGIAMELLLEGLPYISLVLFLVSYTILGGEIVIRALRNITQGQIFDENFLMSAATIGAIAIGEYPEAVAVMLFYQIGEYFQDVAVDRSRKSIADLMDLRPDYANVKRSGDIVKISPEMVTIGEFIIVKPGEKIPLDGVIVAGEGMLDTKSLTGESLPRSVKPGDAALSGCVSQNGLLTIEVTKPFSESTVSKIIHLVETAGDKKAPTENFITIFARYYTPVVVILAALLATVPPLVMGGVWSDWIYRGLVFLVISCPCALVISIPLSFYGGIGGASRRGILVKGGNYIEALSNLDVIVFDKTGTLTKGVFEVTQIHAAKGYTKEQVLEIAAHVEVYSNHPIALSIGKAYGKAVDKDLLREYEEIGGHGISVVLDGKKVSAGNGKLMDKEGIVFSEPEEIGTKVHIAVDGQYSGCVVISDELKPDSRDAIRELKATGVSKTAMLTGDNRLIAEKIAKELSLDVYYAELLPHEKVTKLEELDAIKAPGRKLAFVGDGINDAPVLARADVGIAMGGLGSDAAIEAADVVLMTDEPYKLVTAVEIAKSTHRIVWQNIILVLAVKGVVLSMGAYGIATMWEAVFADVGVALLAVLNAMRVMRK